MEPSQYIYIPKTFALDLLPKWPNFGNLVHSPIRVSLDFHGANEKIESILSPCSFFIPTWTNYSFTKLLNISFCTKSEKNFTDFIPYRHNYLSEFPKYFLTYLPRRGKSSHREETKFDPYGRFYLHVTTFVQKIHGDYGVLNEFLVMESSQVCCGI